MNAVLYSFYVSQLTCFSGCPGRLARLLQAAGGPEALFRCPEQDLYGLGVPLRFHEIAMMNAFRDPAKLEALMEDCERKGIRYIPDGDPAYPERFRVLSDPPPGIFVKGDVPPTVSPAVAVIGARNCTSYGRDMALFFGQAFGKQGVPVISGMAVGIDGYAMRGALSSGGTSFAVLACGADLCYPRENIDLYHRLPASGGILTDKPPGYAGKKYDFPFRNRLISALSDAVIVLEAAMHSGTSITVGYALEQGKEVFALPGRVGDRLSDGCNSLLKNGAQVLTAPEDVFQFLGIRVGQDTVKKRAVSLTKEEKAVADLVGQTPADMETLLEKSAFPLTVLTEVLLRLEIKGVVTKQALEGYVRVPG